MEANERNGNLCHRILLGALTKLGVFEGQSGVESMCGGKMGLTTQNRGLPEGSGSSLILPFGEVFCLSGGMEKIFIEGKACRGRFEGCEARF